MQGSAAARPGGGGTVLATAPCRVWGPSSLARQAVFTSHSPEPRPRGLPRAQGLWTPPTVPHPIFPASTDQQAVHGQCSHCQKVTNTLTSFLNNPVESRWSEGLRARTFELNPPPPPWSLTANIRWANV